MSDDSLHTALLPPIEPGMYRITSAHQGRDSWTCNADHILVVVFTRPPTNVRRHQRQQAHNLPWHFTSLEARFDRKKGNLVIEQDYSFSTESEAETARAAYMKTWQPLVWEGSVAHYLRCEPSVQKQGRMYQPANVQFELEGESLSERLSNVLGVAASEQQVLETATMIGRWIASGVDAASNTVLTSLLHSYRMMGNKRLPRELSTESREVRMALLSGMIEASSEIVAQQRTTLDGYVHLARGLGFCTGKPSLASGNWRVTINEQPSKRADEWSQRSAEFTVQKIAHDNYYGFTVDGNGRFLMDDFVVTHNTKILDKIRQSNVQSHEAGGITQQIGCTWMPRQKILEKTAELCEYSKKELKMDVPGLLMVDTPGHESFTNLRSRGSNLCDIAILVVDIMHGLEPQTIESINLLKQRKTPFIIALNKIDRCYGWKTTPDCPLLKTLANQSDSTRGEFEKRMKEAMLLLSQQGLNTVPYYENPDFRKYISIVPTSAITGEGIPDLLMLLVTLTQQMMNERLTFNNELKCTVLDVKVIEGLGTTIDVILVNGTLEEGQTIVVCGLNGPIVTTVRALLTPPPMHEMRVKADYVHHKVIKAAMGVKISAQGLEQAVAGTSLMVVGKKDNIEELKDEVQSDLATILSKVDKSGQGVAVQASTLGSLEALLSFLEDMKIPVSCINIGPVYKKDIMKAAVMLERRPEYGVLLAFDVKVAPDAQKLADEMGVKIFTADIIYHLFDSCTKYMEEVKAKKRAESAEVAVFPVVLDILPNAIFNVKSPIVLGVRVTEGVARIGTPICIPSKSFLFIGKITGIQKNHVDFTEAKKGEEFACKLEQSKSDQQVVFGRQFDASCQLVSRITRESIDLLKANFKDDVSDAEWKLIIKLKKIFDIM